MRSAERNVQIMKALAQLQTNHGNTQQSSIKIKMDTRLLQNRGQISQVKVLLTVEPATIQSSPLMNPDGPYIWPSTEQPQTPIQIDTMDSFLRCIYTKRNTTTVLAIISPTAVAQDQQILVQKPTMVPNWPCGMPILPASGTMMGLIQRAMPLVTPVNIPDVFGSLQMLIRRIWSVRIVQLRSMIQ